MLKARAANKNRTAEIYAAKHSPAAPSAQGQNANAAVNVEEKGLSSKQLLSVQEVLRELGNMDQTPLQYEMPVETTLKTTGVKDAHISTPGTAAEYS